MIIIFLEPLSTIFTTQLRQLLSPDASRDRREHHKRAKNKVHPCPEVT